MNLTDSASTIQSLKSLWNKNFNLPVYQRSYSWGKKNIETLIDDLKDFYKNTNDKNKDESFFIGNVVIFIDHELDYNNFKLKSIIDGQQRITTLSITVYAIAKLLKKVISNFDYSVEEIGRDTTTTISSKLLNDLRKIQERSFERSIEEDLNDCTHKLQYKDKILSDNFNSFTKNLLNENTFSWLKNEKNNKFTESFSIVKTKIEKTLKDIFNNSDQELEIKLNNEVSRLITDFNKRIKNEPSENVRLSFKKIIKEVKQYIFLQEFYKLIIGKIKFNVLTLNDELDAWKIFVNMNSKGMSLSQIDIVKAFWYKAFFRDKKNIEFFNSKWNNIEAIVNKSDPNKKNINNMPAFFRYTYMIKNEEAITQAQISNKMIFDININSITAKQNNITEWLNFLENRSKYFNILFNKSQKFQVLASNEFDWITEDLKVIIKIIKKTGLIQLKFWFIEFIRIFDNVNLSSLEKRNFSLNSLEIVKFITKRYILNKERTNEISNKFKEVFNYLKEGHIFYENTFKDFLTLTNLEWAHQETNEVEIEVKKTNFKKMITIAFLFKKYENKNFDMDRKDFASTYDTPLKIKEFIEEENLI